MLVLSLVFFFFEKNVVRFLKMILKIDRLINILWMNLKYNDFIIRLQKDSKWSKVILSTMVYRKFKPYGTIEQAHSSWTEA